jgi:aminopeptidase N
MIFRLARLAFAAAFVCAAVAPAGAVAPFDFDTTPGRLPKNVVPVEYRIAIAPDATAKTLRGTETVALDVRRATRRIVFNTLNITIRSARFDGTAVARVDTQSAKQLTTLTLARPAAAGRHTLSLAYDGKIEDSAQGLFVQDYRKPDGTTARMLSTQFESTDARRMFPSWDEPAFRATYRLAVTLPAAWTAVSNMPVASRSVRGALATTTFERTPKMPSYLVMLSAGDLASISGTGSDGVKQSVWAVRGDETDGTYALESAKQILPYFDEYFGVKYPLSKLDHIAIPGGFGGAMENWGGITYNERIIIQPANATLRSKQTGFSIVAHEMAHQWNGDLVTMGWWDDIWLNESFASWMAAKATNRFNPDWNWWQREDASKETAMNADARSSAHAIQVHVADELQADASFDPEITYDKGQAFLRMLEAYLGEDTFRTGIRRYIRAHAYSNATTADLWNALAAASGKNVALLAKHWTEQPGFPLVTVTSQCTTSGARTITLSQQRFLLDNSAGAPKRTSSTPSGTSSAPRRMSSAPRGTWSAPSGTWSIPVALASGTTGAPSFVMLTGTRMDGVPAGRCGDPLRANAGGAGYYRVAYDPTTFEANRSAFASLPDADKIAMLDDQWALARAGRAPVASYLALAGAMAGERNVRAWTQTVASLGELERVARDTPQHDAVAAYARGIVAPVAMSLGWDPKPGESAELAQLRRVVLAALGEWGDSAMVAEARRRFDAELAKAGTYTIDDFQVIAETVGINADAATFDRVHAMAQNTKDAQLAADYRGSLMRVRDPALAERALQLAISDEVPPQQATMRFRYVAAIAARHPKLAWIFLQAHTAALTDPLSVFEKTLSLARTVPEVFARAVPPDELEIWLRMHLPADASPYITRSMQRARTDVAIRARLATGIRTFLADTAKAPPNSP